VELYPAMYFVELLWTLKGHSLGQLEDHVKVISCLHFILLADILEGPLYYGYFLGNLPSYDAFLCKNSCSNGALKIGEASFIASLLQR
jgi:hypothetical protein